MKHSCSCPARPSTAIKSVLRETYLPRHQLTSPNIQQIFPPQQHKKLACSRPRACLLTKAKQQRLITISACRVTMTCLPACWGEARRPCPSNPVSPVRKLRNSPAVATVSSVT
ncbi:unnamed protein product [Leuciscus chuanchicus]